MLYVIHYALYSNYGNVRVHIVRVKTAYQYIRRYLMVKSAMTCIMITDHLQMERGDFLPHLVMTPLSLSWEEQDRLGR
jgi:hypothetical protein